MPKLDDEIDRLYQLPLSEFTKARDELAKRFDQEKKSIKPLQKPNVAAWAVNQLFWRERRKYDALVAAAAKVRAAQVASLKGKAADTAAAEARHAATRKTALDRIRHVLHQSGETLSPATLTAVNETLEALPTDDPPGRLARPLKPMGFEGLAGMVKGSKISLRRAEVVPFRRKTAAAPDKKDTNEQAALRQQIQKLTGTLRDARDAERSAAAAHARAQKTLEAAKAARERAVEALDKATEELGAATRDLDDRERDATLTRRAREQVQAELGVKKHSSSDI